MKMCLTMLDNNYAWQSEALYCGPGAPTLEETLGRVPMPDYARALHYAMFMMRKDYIRLYAIARRQEEQLRFTAGRPAD